MTTETIAYHEAGHAVAAVVLTMRLGRVSVEEDAESYGRAHVSVASSLLDRLTSADSRPMSRRLLERHLICLLAGPEAEARYSGGYDQSGAAGDHLAAADFAMRTTPHYQEWLNAAQARTAALVEREWPTIWAVASELQASRSLSAALLRAIVRGARAGRWRSMAVCG